MPAPSEPREQGFQASGRGGQGQGCAGPVKHAPAAGVDLQVHRGSGRQGLFGTDTHLHQVIAFLQPAGEQLFVAQGLAVAHFGPEIAVGGRGQAEVLGPQSSGEAVPRRSFLLEDLLGD